MLALGVYPVIISRGERSEESILLCSCNQRVEDQGIAMLLTTPDTIRTLQRNFYAKAKQQPAYRRIYQRVACDYGLRKKYFFPYGMPLFQHGVPLAL